MTDNLSLQVSRHMLEIGLGALAHANYHAMTDGAPNYRWAELSVLQAAHAAEMFIKARIAEEDPRLIFERLPKSSHPQSETLTFKHLVEVGRTYQFSALPDRLRIACDIQLPEMDLYKEFGRLRNIIQHFATPEDIDFGMASLNFIYKVIDPFIHDCWGLYAIDYDDEPDEYIYSIPKLISRRIKFLVSPNSTEYLADYEIEWPENDEEYKRIMDNRFKRAGPGIR